MDYVELTDTLDANKLNEEIRAFEKTRFSQLVKTQSEQDLFEQSRSLELAGQLLRFTLSSQEWEEWRNTDRKVLPQHFLEPFERFNQAALLRDKTLTRNLLDHQKKRGFKNAVLISGGFHTEGIKKILRQSHQAYVVLTPRMEKMTTEAGAYLNVFRGTVTPLEQLFARERITLANQSAMALKVIGAAPASVLATQGLFTIEAKVLEYLASNEAKAGQSKEYVVRGATIDKIKIVPKNNALAVTIYYADQTTRQITIVKSRDPNPTDSKQPVLDTITAPDQTPTTYLHVTAAPHGIVTRLQHFAAEYKIPLYTVVYEQLALIRARLLAFADKAPDNWIDWAEDKLQALVDNAKDNALSDFNFDRHWVNIIANFFTELYSVFSNKIREGEMWWKRDTITEIEKNLEPWMNDFIMDHMDAHTHLSPEQKQIVINNLYRFYDSKNGVLTYDWKKLLTNNFTTLPIIFWRSLENIVTEEVLTHVLYEKHLDLNESKDEDGNISQFVDISDIELAYILGKNIVGSIKYYDNGKIMVLQDLRREKHPIIIPSETGHKLAVITSQYPPEIFRHGKYIFIHCHTTGLLSIYSASNFNLVTTLKGISSISFLADENYFSVRSSVNYESYSFKIEKDNLIKIEASRENALVNVNSNNIDLQKTMDIFKNIFEYKLLIGKKEVWKNNVPMQFAEISTDKQFLLTRTSDGECILYKIQPDIVHEIKRFHVNNDIQTVSFIYGEPSFIFEYANESLQFFQLDNNTLYESNLITDVHSFEVKGKFIYITHKIFFSFLFDNYYEKTYAYHFVGNKNDPSKSQLVMMSRDIESNMTCSPKTGPFASRDLAW